MLIQDVKHIQSCNYMWEQVYYISGDWRDMICYHSPPWTSVRDLNMRVSRTSKDAKSGHDIYCSPNISNVSPVCLLHIQKSCLLNVTNRVFLWKVVKLLKTKISKVIKQAASNPSWSSSVTVTDRCWSFKQKSNRVQTDWWHTGRHLYDSPAEVQIIKLITYAWMWNVIKVCLNWLTLTALQRWPVLITVLTLRDWFSNW